MSFEGAPALLRPVVYPSDEDVVAVLDDLVQEMEERYARLAEHRVQDLGEPVRLQSPYVTESELEGLLRG